jgi:hypothetical protein
LFASVIVAVLTRVENCGQGLQGGVGDLGVDGGLAAGLVPQDLDVEGVQQPGLQVRRQAGQHVPGQGELVEQGRVGGAGGGRGQGGELGVELLAFVVQVGEPGADPAAQRGGGGVGRVGGELLEFEDAGVLRGLDLPQPGPDGGGLGVAVGASGGVGGRELGGQQLDATRPEDMVGEEQADDLVQAGFGSLDGARMIRGRGGVPGVGRVVRALVVHPDPGVGRVRAGAHPAAAVPAPDPAPVRIRPRRGRVPAQLVAVAAGRMLRADLLRGLPGVPVDDGRVDGLG